MFTLKTHSEPYLFNLFEKMFFVWFRKKFARFWNKTILLKTWFFVKNKMFLTKLSLCNWTVRLRLNLAQRIEIVPIFILLVLNLYETIEIYPTKMFENSQRNSIGTCETCNFKQILPFFEVPLSLAFFSFIFNFSEVKSI